MRYFLEVSYKGTNYSGFQSQKNANTIQDEIEKALLIFFKKQIVLICSSRTDAGVHALQNFFHFDYEKKIASKHIYNINAILPADIVIKNINQVKSDSHCRFDAISREYKYYTYQQKNPFINDRGFYFPYKVDIKLLNKAASIIMDYSDFTSFSKRNTQVKTFECKIYESKWSRENDFLIYHVKADRFLRGMVKALTSTMLKVGIGKLSIEDFKNIIEAKNCAKASFAVPAHGLFLINVQYPDEYFRS